MPRKGRCDCGSECFPYFGINKEIIRAELKKQYGENAPYKPGMYELYEHLAIENRVNKLFSDAGINPFPSVDAETALKILDCPLEKLQRTINAKKLSARITYSGQIFIRINDLWHYAVKKERNRLLKIKPDPYPYNKSWVKAENTIAAKFTKTRVAVFQEVTAYRAAQIIGCHTSTITRAGRTWRIRSRRVENEHRIPIIELWHYAKNLEVRRLKKLSIKNRL